ncbi:MAG: YbjN domain-containing protein [Pirellulaceae bacterium]
MMRTFLTTLRRLVCGRLGGTNCSRTLSVPKRPPVQISTDRLATDRLATDRLATDRRSAFAESHPEGLAMNDAYQQLIQHFDARDVKYLTHVDSQSLVADFRLEVGTCRVIAAVDAESGLFQVFGYSPICVPEGARRLIAETITRANYGLRIGKFEMDCEEGELRFQVAHILTDDRLDDDVIGRLMGTTVAMLDMYLPAVLSVIFGNETPQDAIRCAEAGRREAEESGSDGSEADA